MILFKVFDILREKNFDTAQFQSNFPYGRGIRMGLEKEEGSRKSMQRICRWDLRRRCRLEGAWVPGDIRPLHQLATSTTTCPSCHHTRILSQDYHSETAPLPQLNIDMASLNRPPETVHHLLAATKNDQTRLLIKSMLFVLK